VKGGASKFAERRPKMEDGVCGRTFTHDKNGDERNEACHQYHCLSPSLRIITTCPADAAECTHLVHMAPTSG
jgi:hypothetical protein